MFTGLAFISPGGGELVVILLVLILLFGAKDAPRILRGIQAALDKLQRAAAEFRYRLLYGDVNESAKDTEAYEVDKDNDDAAEKTS
jgi:Sec-independent protein translocase protein TatA